MFNLLKLRVVTNLFATVNSHIIELVLIFMFLQFYSSKPVSNPHVLACRAQKHPNNFAKGTGWSDHIMHPSETRWFLNTRLMPFDNG